MKGILNDTVAGRKVFASEQDKGVTMEVRAAGGYGSLKFFHSSKDHRGNDQHSELTVRRVGDKNPAADIQISVSQLTVYASGRTRNDCISFSIPADMASAFLKAATEVEK